MTHPHCSDLQALVFTFSLQVSRSPTIRVNSNRRIYFGVDNPMAVNQLTDSSSFKSNGTGTEELVPPLPRTLFPPPFFSQRPNQMISF